MIQSASAVLPRVAKSDIAYAGFWRRLLAYLIDGTLLAGVELALYSTVHVLAPDNLDAVANIVPGLHLSVLHDITARKRVEERQRFLTEASVGLAASLDYETTLAGLTRCIVPSLADSWLVCGIGWVLAAVTPRKQALHDLLAGTLVLRKVNYFVIGPEAPTEPGDHWDGKRWVASVPPLEKS